jgi:hypothetical protein
VTILVTWFVIGLICVLIGLRIINKDRASLKTFCIWARYPGEGWLEVGCQFAMTIEKVDLELARSMYPGRSLLVLEIWDTPYTEQRV